MILYPYWSFQLDSGHKPRLLLYYNVRPKSIVDRPIFLTIYHRNKSLYKGKKIVRDIDIILAISTSIYIVIYSIGI